MKNSTIVPLLSDASDVALITAVAAERSGAALEEMHRRFTPMLRSVIMRVVSSTADADEVLQDVFIQVWHQADHYSSEKGHLLGWLITVARRRALDHVRKACAYRNATDRYEKVVREPEGSANSCVDEEVQQNELKSQMEHCLRLLPPPQREAVDLTFYKGLSQREIAARLSVPLGTVKTRIELGLRKLGRSLLATKAA